MARSPVPIQVIAPEGSAVAGADITLKNRLDSTAATHYSAESGGSSSTTAISTDSFGEPARWIKPGRYLYDLAPPSPNPLGLSSRTGVALDVPVVPVDDGTSVTATVEAPDGSAATNGILAIASNASAGVARVSLYDTTTEKWRIDKTASTGSHPHSLRFIDQADSNLVFRITGGVPNTTKLYKTLHQYDWTATPTGDDRVINFFVSSTVSGISFTNAEDLVDNLQSMVTMNNTTGTGGCSVCALAGEAKVSAATNIGNEASYLRGVTVDSTGVGAIHPRIWGMDTGVHGTPRNEQNRLLVNGVFFINTHHDASPVGGPAAGLSVTTKFGTGPGATATHQAQRTYSVDAGLHVYGWAGDSNGISHANAEVGFRYGVLVGGTGIWHSASGWTDTEQDSRIGTGIQVMHYEAAGIKVTNRSTIAGTSPPAISIGWDNAGAASASSQDGLWFGGDVVLYRSAADTLTTEDVFQSTQSIRVTGAAGVGFFSGVSQTSSPGAAGTAGVGRIYFRNGKLVIAYNNAGTNAYFSLDLTAASPTVTWTNHGTTAP
jgi:hypothetical protein